ncbi:MULTISPECIES: hypothetical protein [Nocardiaceae]|nr:MULTISPECIES: hypothetical protein [Rhodococcus]
MGEIKCRPLILIRGFGGVDVADDQRSAYQGYNDGTVYPTKRGDNYIYEGFLLRALKAKRYRYTDATNVVGYYAQNVEGPADTGEYDPSDVGGSVVIDPRTAARVLNEATSGTIWVYRFYDLSPRTLARYAEGLVRLISLIERSSEQHNQTFDGVDVIARLVTWASSPTTNGALPIIALSRSCIRTTRAAPTVVTTTQTRYTLT